MTSLVVGTAGHIDHGKSTLVRALTGIDPDRLKEEKARGITIELGFAHAVIGETRVAFVDVPGHERFVRTMLAGVGGIDCVLLIVAADESVMPQTREHFEICRLLRIPRGIIVLTKADLADADTRLLVRQEVAELVKGSFLEGAAVIEVSASTGDGLDALRAAIASQAAEVSQRPATGATRLPIDRAFTMKGFGTVITGTLVSGRLGVDDDVVLLPSARRAKVRGIQVHGATAVEASAGQRTAVNLGGVEVGQIARGETLAQAGSLSVTRRIDTAIDLLASAKPLKHGARVRLHHGTAEVLGRVSIAGTAVELAAGARAFARVRLETAAALTRGDRFILRAYSPPITIGGGTVIDPAPTRPGVRSAEGLESLAALDLDPARHPADAVAAMVTAAGLPGLPRDALTARAGVPPAAIASTVAALAARSIEAAGDRLVAASHLARAKEALVKLVAAFHRAQPLSDGLPREEAREKVAARAEAAIFERLVDDLKKARTLVGADRLALATHTVAATGEDARIKGAIAAAYAAAGLKPPDAATVQAAAGAPAAMVEKITAVLIREKVLVRLDTLTFHASGLQVLKDEIRAMKAGSTGGPVMVDVAAFKDKYGISRKFAIPLLEYLDRERVTRRTGDARTVI
ncbi:MAG: selenocysteine-specific translation elongation factor [Acidobacteriota bacterium]|nr:selenocysteine-specific translation elongation factor [Acidobacteriota bacterium]